MSDFIALEMDEQERAELRPFPLNPNYLVSPRGRVLNWKRTGWLKPCVMKRGGYLAVSLWEQGKTRGHLWTLNKIIAWTFHGVPVPPRTHAAHNDGTKTNNTRENIAWKSKVENEADKILHGTTNRGERNGAAKLTNAQVREIIKKAETMNFRGKNRRLAEEYGVTGGAISNILLGKRRHYG